MLTAVAIAVVVVASVLLVPLASAASNPVATGSTTTITLNSGFTKKLSKSKIKLTGVKPATVKGKNVTLPIEEGSLETNGQGTLTHSGGLKFKAGKKSVTLKALVLDTTKSSLTGKLGGKNMKIASVSGVTATREGFGVTVAVKSMKLTGKAAGELNKKLGFSGKSKKKGKRASASASSDEPFKGNQVLGGSSSPTQPKTIGVLASGSAKLDGNLETLVKFGGLKVEISPIEPTKKENLATFLFPIGGGNIAPNGMGGVPQTLGGIMFKQEVAPTFFLTMTLKNIWVDMSSLKATAEVSIEDNNIPGVETPGPLGRVSIADIKPEGATIVPNPDGHTVTVANANAVLEETTAFTLNSTFAPEEPPKSGKHKEVFKAGDSLGLFSFTATTE
ncbi:MAG: hypothetical protein ACHQCF_06595 [Solirubrobacterales bacterium]